MAVILTTHSVIAPSRSVCINSICLTVILTFAVQALALGQQQESDSTAKAVEKKVIHEPVYRVPHVADARASGTNVDPEAQPSKPNTEPKSAPSKPKNVKRNAVPATLPRATRDPSENRGPAASKSSSVKPIPHPLDEALAMAHRGLLNIRENVRDYSAIMVKRERVNGKLLKPEYMQMKFRSERIDEQGNHVPFSIYAKFLKPQDCAGREVIWVKGHNNNKLYAHEGQGLPSLKTLSLDPDGWIAMRGNRYPIYEAGMENLIVKLIEKAERDRAAGACDVQYLDKKLNGRPCTLIEVKHPEQRAPYDFHIARVFIDKELKLPIRYQAYLWPSTPGGKPPLLEEYAYLKVKLNQGFTDQDFNTKNKAYRFR